MKEKILALLIAKFSGVRKDGLAQLAGVLSLQAETDEQAAGLVDKMTTEKVSAFITEYRKDVDKEVSEANKTYEGNLKKKFDFVEKREPRDPGKDPKDPADPSDIASIVANAVKAAIDPLEKKLSSFEGEKIKQSRLQQLEGKLKDVPDTFKAQKLKDFSRMNFDSEEAFTEYLTETETDITAFNQELANKGLAAQGKPIFGGKDQNGVSSAVSSYLTSKAEGNKSLTGKEV